MHPSYVLCAFFRRHLHITVPVYREDGNSDLLGDTVETETVGDL